MLDKAQFFVLIFQESNAVATEVYGFFIDVAQDREAAHNASFFLAVRETKGMSHLMDSNFCRPFKKAS
jgi:hypothetical protein